MTTKQLPLFGAPPAPPAPPPPTPPSLPYVVGSDTSQAAAESVAAQAGRVAALILGLLRLQGAHGAIDSELEELLGLSHQTASARRRGLELEGKVVRTPLRRKTSSGRWAHVYVLPEYENEARWAWEREQDRA